MSISIRLLTLADLEAADELLGLAFNLNFSRIPEMTRYLAIQPDGWFVAELDGIPMGMVGALDYGTFAHIGLMAVHPSAQRRGIGRMLMDYVIKWIEDRGTEIIILDATPAGAMLYPQLGFIDEGTAVLMHLAELPKLDAVNTSGVRTITLDDLPALVAFDAPIFGGNRQRLFARLLDENPDRGLLRTNTDGEITGFIFTQPKRIGPMSVLSTQDAQSLFAASLKLPFNPPFEPPIAIILPQENAEAIKTFSSFGFTQTRTTLHMRRGGSEHPGKMQYLYAKASHAIG